MSNSVPENQQQYGSILTILGENAEQNGKLLNKQIEFTHIAFGDANDTYVQPDRKSQSLVNELHRIPVNSVDVIQPDPDSIPMLKVEAILPDDVNDLVIREFAAVATFNDQEYFHAIGNCARIYVPTPVNNGNVSNPVTLEMIFVITSAEPIVLIDPGVIQASRSWVKDNFLKKGDSFSKEESDERYEPIIKNFTSFAACKDASPLAFSGTDYQPDDLNKSEVILGSDANSGVLVSATSGAYFDLVMPYAVIIGDSISEGHPALHGRLHPGSSSFDPDYKSQPGQLSYEFSTRFGLPFVNQGIGGQTSVDIRNRWDRDVLHKVYDVGDGRGDSTMSFSNQLPYMVYLHVGVNDVFLGVATSTIKENFRFFAQSCRENNILLVADNIGADSVYDAPKEAAAREINVWLSSEFAQEFPEVELIDYLDWSCDGTGDYTHLKPGMFVDTVHPSKAGYADFASYVESRISKPVFLTAFTLNSTISGPGRFSRITEFKFNDNKYIAPYEKSTIELGALSDIDDPVYRLEALSYEIVTGDGTNQYSGFAQAFGQFSNKTNSKIIKPEGSDVTGGVVAAGVILNSYLNSSWKSFGIVSVDDGDLVNANLTIHFSEPVTHLVVTMVGSSHSSHTFMPRWTSGSIPDGDKTWTINLTRITDGVIANTRAYHNYQIIGYRFT
ncbi:phage tail protein [Vibrio parahaemolyticus]|uniref:phage tail-collar fiber domain-containing protein n=1 Tax=Vibrio parahaemolyticus TaxID=670 RepID=UPI00235F28B4|nr:phage tail protein [Vibrio parahaemolyticus]